MAEKHIDNHSILKKVLDIFENAVNEVVEDKRTDVRRKADNEKLKKQLRNLSINLNKKMLEEAPEYMNPEQIKDILKKMMD
tara:strand:- start:1504 stop:1746 length:243 start_codon:yes stop_codon:yes gene_type:complete